MVGLNPPAFDVSQSARYTSLHTLTFMITLWSPHMDGEWSEYLAVAVLESWETSDAVHFMSHHDFSMIRACSMTCFELLMLRLLKKKDGLFNIDESVL